MKWSDSPEEKKQPFILEKTQKHGVCRELLGKISKLQNQNDSRQVLEEMGTPQADVAEKLNTTKTVISRGENHAEIIKLFTLTKYAKGWARRLSSKFSRFKT